MSVARFWLSDKRSITQDLKDPITKVVAEKTNQVSADSNQI